MSSEFTTVVVVGISIEFISVGAGSFGDLNGGDLEVVLGLAGGVGAEEETVGCVGFVGWSGDMGSGRLERGKGGREEGLTILCQGTIGK